MDSDPGHIRNIQTLVRRDGQYVAINEQPYLE